MIYRLSTVPVKGTVEKGDVELCPCRMRTAGILSSLFCRLGRRWSAGTDPVHGSIKARFGSSHSVLIPGENMGRQHAPRRRAVSWTITCRRWCPLCGWRGAGRAQRRSGWSWVKNVATVQWTTGSEGTGTRQLLDMQLLFLSVSFRATPEQWEALKAALQERSSMNYQPCPRVPSVWGVWPHSEGGRHWALAHRCHHLHQSTGTAVPSATACSHNA